MSSHESMTSFENRILLPLNLLALSVAIILCAMLFNTVRQRAILKEEIRQTQIQGQNAVDARLHYYSLYKELFALSPKNNDAEIIVKKYGIQFTEPAAETNGVPLQ